MLAARLIAITNAICTTSVSFPNRFKQQQNMEEVIQLFRCFYRWFVWFESFCFPSLSLLDGIALKAKEMDAKLILSPAFDYLSVDCQQFSKASASSWNKGLFMLNERGSYLKWIKNVSSLHHRNKALKKGWHEDSSLHISLDDVSFHIMQHHDSPIKWISRMRVNMVRRHRPKWPTFLQLCTLCKIDWTKDMLLN